MAKPIKETPVLLGEAAKAFFKEMDEPANPVAVRFVEESKEAYSKYKKTR